MKIFGWMHRKLHLGSTEYHRVAHRNSPDMLFDDEIGRKSGTVPGARERSEDDTDSLLLPDVLLAIGTFGHSDPLQQQQQQQISHGEQQHEEDALGHAEEPAPEFTAKITAAVAAVPELNAPGELEMTMNVVKQQEIAEEEMASEEPLLKEDKEKTERRTTLADLFAAEPASAGDRPSPPEAVSAAGKEKVAGPRKNVKKIKKGKDRSPVSTNATERIHQLITKMLKKKVHPDVTRADEERRGKREGAASTSEGNEGGARGVDFRLPRG